MMESLNDVANFRPVTMIVTFPFIFLIVRAIYRLTLHPLAKFPGPKIAAITSLYQASFDISRSPCFVKILPKLHDRYGPIIRTAPNELHIRDFGAYYEVFKMGTKFHKPPPFYQANPHLKDSFFAYESTKAVKPYRDLYAPYFSRASVCRIERLIQEQLIKFLNVIKNAAQENRVLNMTLGFKALTSDIAMYYCYQKTFGALDAPGFQFEPLLALDEFFGMIPYIIHFPKAFQFMNALLSLLPSSAVESIFRGLAASEWIRKQNVERLAVLRARPKSSIQDAPIPTIFDTVLSLDPSKSRFVPPEQGVISDALIMFAGGTDTTANVLSRGTYEMLRNPRILHKLKAELRQAIPNKDNMVNWTTLESLPYLTAVIKESLRLGYGVPGKIPRYTPPTGATLCGHHIPPGTVLSLSAYAHHQSAVHFEDPSTFHPERWLISDTTELDRCLISFSRGSRACLGINLAYAELYLTFAHLCRRYDMRLEGVKESDMDWYDTFTVTTNGHLRLVFKEAEN